MNREKILKIFEGSILETSSRLYNIHKGSLKIYPGYEGAANLVYDYELDGVPMILRITFRPERTVGQIRAELDFVNYLADQGVRVSKPVPSQDGNLVETFQAEGILFQVVSFIKGKGMRVPDNGYRYREDAPIEEYFRNWGRVLGQMHAATKDYIPQEIVEKRPDWFGLHKDGLQIESLVPARLALVRDRIQGLLDAVRSLPKNRDTYGLIHGDFNDGNFTVDYDNGDITVFDFDDCCYFWFMYEIAAAWEGGIGRAMFRSLDERVAFMDHYMETLMAGYNQQNRLPENALDQLPLFLQLIQVEEFLHYIRYIDSPDEDIQAGLRYKIKCIQEDIPLMGFYDSLYNPENPFSLDRS